MNSLRGTRVRDGKQLPAGMGFSEPKMVSKLGLLLVLKPCEPKMVSKLGLLLALKPCGPNMVSKLGYCWL